MKPADIFLFLIGNRGAIQRVSGSWWSLLIGALLVVTAGIARNYDHIDFLNDCEWLYGPFVASLITSLLVFSVVTSYLKLGKANTPPHGIQHNYLSFLSLYWMTAPCAWIYGIPVESFTDLLTATKWNIAFLTVVSLWRVILMVRSIHVLSGAGIGTCTVAILLPSSVVMFFGSFFKKLSLVGVMGGVRLPPHTQLLSEATGTLTSASFLLAFITCLIWFAGLCNPEGVRAFAVRALPWNKATFPKRTLISCLILIALSMAAIYPIQQKVRRNHQLSQLIKTKQYQEAVEYASQFNENEFSTIHYLPPNPYKIYGHNSESYPKLLSELDDTSPPWLHETWSKQYIQMLLSSRFGLGKQHIEYLNNHAELKEQLLHAADSDAHKHILINLENKKDDDETPPTPDH